MAKTERAVIEMGSSPESFRDRQELLAQRLALGNRKDVEYVFRGDTYRVTLKEAVKNHSVDHTEQRIRNLLWDLERDAQRLLEKEDFVKEEMEKEKKYAKMASEIKL